MIKLVKNLPLFNWLPDAELGLLLTYLDTHLERFPKGEYINTLGSRITEAEIGCLISGRVQHIKYDIRGNRSILDILTPGCLMGCSHALLSRHSYHTTNMVAAEESLILFFSYQKLEVYEPSVSPLIQMLEKRIMQILAERNSKLMQKADVLSKRTIREKVLTYLSYLKIEAGPADDVSINVHLTHQEMADYLNVDRSALSRELSKLRREGILDYRSNHFVLNLSDDIFQEIVIKTTDNVKFIS